MEEEAKKIIEYKPSVKEQEEISFVYNRYRWMDQEVMGKSYPEFNYRTLKQFLDDSQKRANGTVPTRAEQDKEEWQANVFTGTTRNKTRAYCGSVTKQPPQTRIVATNDENKISVDRADVMRSLVQHSYLYCENPELNIFNDGWDCAVNGTVIKYDGYLLVKEDVPKILNWNPTTGEMEVEYEEMVVEDRPIELDVPVLNLLISDPYEPDVQKQPDLIWSQYVTLDEFNYEFGKYKNAKYVKLKPQIQEGNRELYFGPKWTDRVNENKVEVLRYYNKRKNKYCIVANGVLVFKSPLLWGRKKKFYPFPKSIFEPFANRRFFWGNSLPNIMMPHQDTENRLVNAMLDKTYRSVDTPMLVSMENKDALELEDEIVTGDSRIYVNDINGVKPYPTAGVTQAEINMLNDVSQRLALASLDALQEGQTGKGVTAREIVISNERAAEIKGIFYMLLSDLWLQKTRLRVINIITFYGRVGKQYNIPKMELANGQLGTQQIRVGTQEEVEAAQRPMGYKSPGEPFNALDVEEEMLRLKGNPTEIIVIPYDYLDNWEYEVEIMTETLYQRGKSLTMAVETEKLNSVATLFPGIFQQNQQKFFGKLMRQYGDSPENYDVESMPQPQVPGEAGGELTANLTAPTKPLPALAGAE